MRKLAIFVVLALAFSAVASATVFDCPLVTTLATLTTTFGPTSGNQCQSQDKLFSNFFYQAVGSDPIASNVTASLRFQTVGDIDVHGWGFQPTNAWTQGFLLSYDIFVIGGSSSKTYIYQSKDQMFTVPSNNLSTAMDYQVGVTPYPLSMTSGSETVYSTIYNLQTIHTATTATIVGTSNMNSYEQSWFENTGSGVPEPMSFVLIGSGLVGLGLMRRRTRKS